MATSRPWMAWYPAHIFADPKYIVLSRSAKLTYRELLDRCWMAGAALPNDPRKLAALAGMTLADFEIDWMEMQDPDDPCFITHPVISGFLTNRRVFLEWNIAEANAERARQNGKRGGRPTRIDTSEKTQPVISGLAKPNPEESSLPLPVPEEVRVREQCKNTARGTSATDRVPHQQIIDLYHEILPELPRVEIWTTGRQAILRQRWREDTERQNLDWWRKFFSFVRGSPFLLGKKNSWNASLEWLIRPKNFPKVLEGQYHERQQDEVLSRLSEKGQRTAMNIARVLERRAKNEQDDSGSGD